MGVKKLELSMLCDIYGTLLSEKQREALEMYCNEDYSLAEIAENTGISRQGVRDQIKHAESQLFTFEEKLKLMERNSKVSDKLNSLAKNEAVNKNPELLQLVKDIQDILSFE